LVLSSFILRPVSSTAWIRDMTGSLICATVLDVKCKTSVCAKICTDLTGICVKM
jgi:hypothetical protein